MFALSVRYLTGRAAAGQVANREEPEWPPHPDRFFMALVSAWGTRSRDSAERNALAWLETLPPPSLRASGCSHAGKAVSFFVPVNDGKDNLSPERKIVGNKSAGRHKAKRHFPSVIPDEDTVHFIWDADMPTAHRTAIAELCRNVTYLGHSSTLVQAWLADNAPGPNLVPTEDDASMRLRITRTGRLDHLIAAQDESCRPRQGAWCGYGPPQAMCRQPPASNLAGDFLVLHRASGDRLGLASTLALTGAMRDAAMAHATQPPCEILSGHSTDGKPTLRTHVAYVPLADVGHKHADGHLLGLAAILPLGLSPAESEECIQSIAHIRCLTLGHIGAWNLEDAETNGRIALEPQTWIEPSRRWASITPIVLDRFPKKDGDAEETVARACEIVGLPRPIAVMVHPISRHQGVPTSREFPALPTKAGDPRRWHTHAAIIFADDVAGPVLLGAGRFRGYGFFRSLRSTGNTP
jgi:CRISPR-associated protein Csb2